MTLLASGCLTLPDGPDRVDESFAPVLDLGAVVPESSVIRLPPDANACPPFELVACVADADDDPLLVRCITDLRTETQRVLAELEIGRAGGTFPRAAKCPGISAAAFDDRLASVPHTLAIAITDAPSFRHAATSTAPLDEIDPDPDRDGVDEHGVVAVRWAVHFDPAYPCPPPSRPVRCR